MARPSGTSVPRAAAPSRATSRSWCVSMPSPGRARKARPAPCCCNSRRSMSGTRRLSASTRPATAGPWLPACRSKGAPWASGKPHRAARHRRGCGYVARTTASSPATGAIAAGTISRSATPRSTRRSTFVHSSATSGMRPSRLLSTRSSMSSASRMAPTLGCWSPGGRSPAASRSQPTCRLGWCCPKG